jgi:hypothetical protein
LKDIYIIGGVTVPVTKVGDVLQRITFPDGTLPVQLLGKILIFFYYQKNGSIILGYKAIPHEIFYSNNLYG